MLTTGWRDVMCCAGTQEAQQQQQDKQTCRLAEIKPKAESLSLVEVTGTNDKVKNFLNRYPPPNSPSYSSGSLLFLTTGPTNLQPLRLLGLEVEDQILIFQLFTNYYEMEVRQFSP